MIKLMMVVPNPSDATSLYRAMGPMSNLRRKISIDTVMPEKADWWTVDNVDVCFMQRPFTESHLKLAALCVRHEVPLWIDYDDLLFDVPDDNPAYEHYMNKQTKDNIIKIIQMADVVTVSTEQIKRCLQVKQNSLNNEVHVIPNACPERWMKKAVAHKRKKHVNWRGTNTHQADLACFAGEMVDLADKHKDATFTFIGYNPWFITRRMGPQQAIVVPTMTIDDYIDFMVKTNPAYQITPLDNHMFNHCKSNISWIEGTIAGSVSVAPDWREWRKPGVVTYKNGEDFMIGVDALLSGAIDAKKLHEESMQYIKENLLLSHVNLKREWILTELHNKSRGIKMSLPPGGAMIESEEVMELA